MRSKGMKLSRRHRGWFYASFSALFLSGLVWVILHYCAPSALEPLALKIHGAAAMIVLILLGTLIPRHIKKGWQANLNRGSGSFMIATNVFLICSGYALYYAGGEWLRRAASISHILIGILFPVFLVWHIVTGRRERKKMARLRKYSL